jgi:hypothetical protein
VRQFATEFADANPDNPYAAAFAAEIRKAKAALVDGMHNLRQALGLTALDAREGAERELAAHAGAMRPDVIHDKA